MSSEEGQATTTTRTFRIVRAWEAVLEEEAERQHISVSALMNKILEMYVENLRFCEHHSPISVDQITFRAILDLASEDEIAEAGGKLGASRPMDELFLRGLTTNEESIYQLISRHYGEYGKWFDCYHHRRNNRQTFYLRHDLGSKWSIFLDFYFTAMLKSLLGVRVETETTDNDVTIFIESK